MNPPASWRARHLWLMAALLSSGMTMGGCTDADYDGVPDANDACTGTPACALVDTNGCPIDGDSDGVYDGCDDCPDTPLCATVDAAGCPIDSDRDGDGVYDGCDECPDTPPSTTVGTDGCPVLGLAYGAFRQYERPEGLQPTAEEIVEDLELLRAMLPTPPRVRIYSAIRGSGSAAIEAAKLGFHVTLGAWIGQNAEANEEEIQALIEIANQYPLAAVLVGNEVLLRDDVPADALAAMIQRVRQAVPKNVPVGTAEVHSTWSEDRASVVADASDILLVHVHPYWEGIPAGQAAATVFQHYDEVAQRYQDKRVIIGETGWPSAGQTENNAIPSPENQELFLRDFAAKNSQRRIEAFLFSAFDETWKGTGDRPTAEAMATTGYNGHTEEGDTGAHWGVLRWNRTIKPDLARHFPALSDPLCSSATLDFVLFTQGFISPGHDMAIDSSSGRTGWVTTSDYLRLGYPAGECWATVFITVGEPTTEIPRPHVEDLSTFSSLVFEARGDAGGESVEVSIQDDYTAGEHTAPSVCVSGLQTQWRTAVIALSEFEGVDLARLYVPIALNFSGTNTRAVYVRNIRYVPPECSITSDLEISHVTRPAVADGAVYVDGCLERWYSIGVDASEQARDWAETIDGALRLSYPSGQQWGALFISVGELTSVRPRPSYQDFSSFAHLLFEARGERGNESFDVGVKDRYAPDTGQETKVPIGPLSTDWQQFSIPTSQFVGTELSELYIAFEAVFTGNSGQTIFIRHIRYEP